MESAPGQPSESAYESLLDESLGGSGDSFSGDPESFDEPEPPDVGESLQQMNQRLEELSQRVDEADDGYDEDGFDPDELQYNPALAQPEDGEYDDTAQLRELLAAEVDERVGPYLDHIEGQYREQQILQLAERYPQLREPETLDAIAQEVDAIADAYSIPGARTDPRLIERLLIAHLAEQAVANAPEQGQDGAHLETGTGPGAPEPEVDAATQAWLAAALPDQNPDAFSR